MPKAPKTFRLVEPPPRVPYEGVVQPPPRQRGYTTRWDKARKTFLARHPFCAQCRAAGRVVDATVVDHITPHKGDKRLFWDSANWQPLCARCHNRKTARGE